MPPSREQTNWGQAGSMAEKQGETLNSLFDILADWNHQLKHAKVDFEEPRP